MNAKVLVIRGLLSVFLSRAMESLTNRINGRFPGVAEVTDHGWAIAWFSNVPAMTRQCIAAKRAGQKVLLIGHSFGATSVLAITRNMKLDGLTVDFAGPIDPAGQYDTSIPNNVAKGISYFQRTPGQLGQGIVHPDDTWKEGEFAKRFSVHQRFENHLQIAADPVVQEAMYNAVVDTLAKK